MFEHLFFIYLNCFLRIIIFYYFFMPCPCYIHVLVFWNFSCRCVVSPWSWPCFLDYTKQQEPCASKRCRKKAPNYFLWIPWFPIHIFMNLIPRNLQMNELMMVFHDFFFNCFNIHLDHQPRCSSLFDRVTQASIRRPKTNYFHRLQQWVFL